MREHDKLGQRAVAVAAAAASSGVKCKYDGDFFVKVTVEIFCGKIHFEPSGYEFFFWRGKNVQRMNETFKHSPRNS